MWGKAFTVFGAPELCAKKDKLQKQKYNTLRLRCARFRDRHHRDVHKVPVRQRLAGSRRGGLDGLAALLAADPRVHWRRDVAP